MNIPTTENSNKTILILVLGALTALGPFSIDMYLPGFPEIAKDLETDTSRVALSLSSYFIGISAGQLLYGPLMDRFGRKPPLYLGLALYLVASIACALCETIDSLIAWRFVQAIGSCAATVGAAVMVRDLFPISESSRIFSLLILVLGTSPMIAPTLGGYVTSAFGWQTVFIILAVLAVLLLIAVRYLLPVAYKADPSLSLKPGPILRNFRLVLSNKQFITYALTGASAFSGLFVYVSGSPQVFMEIFHMEAKIYGWIFAGLSVGFIGASQVSSKLLKYFTSEQIVYTSLLCQAITSVAFLVLSLNGLTGLVSTIGFIFIYLCCLGLIAPNTSALALAPFNTNAGSASSLLGVSQMTLGALASTGVSLFHASDTTPMILVMSVASVTASIILIFGKRVIRSLANTKLTL
ncbi:multidrug effflux MFS transporter [Flavitalea sp.]|nr:multidrug effflux MFS transporter [Flavitalea sp.]